MSRSLTDLHFDFKPEAEQLIERCELAGMIMRPFFTLRTPFEQAKLWRQSRTSAQIQQKILHLRALGAHYLADCIECVGPQQGRWATNAIPGLSWHNWGLALDCFHLNKKGVAEWSADHRAYEVYANIAKDMGLTSGYFWKKRDAVHVQKPKASSPLNEYTIDLINDIMKERFT